MGKGGYDRQNSEKLAAQVQEWERKQSTGRGGWVDEGRIQMQGRHRGEIADGEAMEKRVITSAGHGQK